MSPAPSPSPTHHNGARAPGAGQRTPAGAPGTPAGTPAGAPRALSNSMSNLALGGTPAAAGGAGGLRDQSPVPNGTVAR